MHYSCLFQGCFKAHQEGSGNIIFEGFNCLGGILFLVCHLLLQILYLGQHLILLLGQRQSFFGLLSVEVFSFLAQVFELAVLCFEVVHLYISLDFCASGA